VPDEQDRPFALLRPQLRALERKPKSKPRLAPPEKFLIVALVTGLPIQRRQGQQQVRDAGLLVQPATVLQWLRALIRRKGTFQPPNRAGRPRLDADIEALILRIAGANPRMGYAEIHAALLKLGFSVDPTTVQHVLRRHRLSPAPQPAMTSGRPFLKPYRPQRLAGDCFTLETLHRPTLYRLCFIELGSRRVDLAGCTASPDQARVTQQAWQLVWQLDQTKTPRRFRIQNRDRKFTTHFDQVFVSEGIQRVRTPFRAPNANAIAQRWVRSVRQEWLDHLLILNQRHLNRVLKAYTDDYNASRPHQALGQPAPIPWSRSPHGVGRCRDVLAGILHHDYRDAA
jgi:transposase InsO family protein